MVFLPQTNTVILLEPYCGTIIEPGRPVVSSSLLYHIFWDVLILKKVIAQN